MVSIYKFNTIEDNDTIKVFHSSQEQEYDVLSVYYDENNNRIVKYHGCGDPWRPFLVLHRRRNGV